MWYLRLKIENICMSVWQLMWYRRPNIENICIYEIVRVLYGETIDVILTAEHKNYMRIKKRTVNAPCSSWTRKNTFGVIQIVKRFTSFTILQLTRNALIPSSINQYMVGFVHSLHMKSDLNPKKKLYPFSGDGVFFVSDCNKW